MKDTTPYEAKPSVGLIRTVPIVNPALTPATRKRCHWGFVLLAAMAAALLARSVRAQSPPAVTLQAPIVYSGDANTIPFGVTTGDFNNDGYLDFAVAEHNPIQAASDQIAIYSGNADGSFTETSIIPVDGTISGQANTVNHVIGAGHFLGLLAPVGVVVAVSSSSLCSSGHGVVVVNGIQPGNGSTPTCVSTSSAPTSVAVGDFNGDTYDDFAVGNASGDTNGSVSVFLGGTSSFSENGSYTASVLAGPTLYGTVVAGNYGVDGPGIALLASTGPFTQYVSAFLNARTPSGALTFIVGGGASTGSNGFEDVAIASIAGTVGSIVGISNADALRYITVGLNLTTGTVSYGSENTLGGGPLGYALVSADFNGDSVADVAFLDSNHNLKMNLGTGTSTTSTIGPFGVPGQDLAAGFSTQLNKWVVVDAGVVDVTNSSFQEIPEARSLAVYLLDPTTGQPPLAPAFAQSSLLVDTSMLPAFAVADLDGDGAPDVAVLGEDQTDFSATVTPFQNVYATNSSTGFEAKPVFDLGSGGLSEPNLNASAVVAGHFRSAVNNPAGLPDLALVLPDGITVLENEGAFQFDVDTGCQGVSSAGTNCYLAGDANYPGLPASTAIRPAVIATDVNGDGVDDIVLAIPENCNASDSGGSKARLYVLISNGDGSFQAALSYPTGFLNGLCVSHCSSKIERDTRIYAV